MPRPIRPPQAPIRSRAELDIELARLTLRLTRAMAHVAHGLPDVAVKERRDGVREWFGDLAQSLLARVDPALRAYGVQRIRTLLSRHPGIDPTPLDPIFATVQEARGNGPRLH